MGRHLLIIIIYIRIHVRDDARRRDTLDRAESETIKSLKRRVTRDVATATVVVISL